ncbi:hypothetical protein M758_8G161000 [Ceratodon purpureus]|nr:hypothetical protein M758_8G161000 [Ceratodon purpureus]
MVMSLTLTMLISSVYIVLGLFPSHGINLVPRLFVQLEPFRQLNPAFHQCWVLIQHGRQLLSLTLANFGVKIIHQ